MPLHIYTEYGVDSHALPHRYRNLRAIGAAGVTFGAARLRFASALQLLGSSWCSYLVPVGVDFCRKSSEFRFLTIYLSWFWFQSNSFAGFQLKTHWVVKSRFKVFFFLDFCLKQQFVLEFCSALPNFPDFPCPRQPISPPRSSGKEYWKQNAE